MPKHVVDRGLTGKHRPAIPEHDPTIRPRLAEINVQGLVDTDDQGDPHQRVLVELFAARLRLPCVVGGRGEATEQAPRLSLVQAPFRGDVHKNKNLDGARAQMFSFDCVGQVRRLIEGVASNVRRNQRG